RGAPPLSARTQIPSRPCSSLAVNATLAPSGEMTAGPEPSSFMRKKFVFSGPAISARTSTAGGAGLYRKNIAVPSAASNNLQPPRLADRVVLAQLAQPLRQSCPRPPPTSALA